MKKRLRKLKFNRFQARFFTAISITLFATLNVLTYANTSSKENLLNEIKYEENLNTNLYLLGEGDLINISFFDAPELSRDLFLMNDGTLNVPLLGSVKVSGMTINEATKKIAKLLSKELIRPQLQLTVIKPRPIKVSIIGEIQRPGFYSLTNNEKQLNDKSPNISIGGLPTVVDAIQKAGGVTEKANLKKVILKRKISGEGLTYKKASLDLLSLILEGNQVQNPYLQDGDTIILKPVINNANLSMKISSSNLSPKKIKVNVIGAVENPGQYELNANTPLVQAVLAAGGALNKRANYRNIELIRINNNGSASLKRYVLNFSQGVDNSKNPKLKNGDTVKVNANLLASSGEAVKVVSEPVSGLLQIWTLFKLIQ